MKQKILILGVGGMLGSMLLDVFSRENNFSVVATTHSKNLKLIKDYPNVQFRTLDVEHIKIDDLSEILKDIKWVVNAIGVINTYIHDDNAAEVERAIRINALFPYVLAEASLTSGAKVIQIATDCVYKCDKGQYSEQDEHDAIDVYGKTKSLGEAPSDNMYHLRCSIIGPELTAHLSLLDWFLNQPKGAKLNGFRNHIWNGVTTLHFAKICLGIIKNDIKIDHIQHVIPTDTINKHDLLKVFAIKYNRNDIKINAINAPKHIDRTLVTDKPDMNKKIWKSAGYKEIPTIEDMVKEISQYSRSIS